MDRNTDNFQKVLKQDAIQRARQEWIRQRIELIHRSVTAYDVLRRHGVELRHAGDGFEEQFSCPFHGVDRKPSARIYPEGRGPSHAWCFVCQERWDCIALWRKFNGSENDSFTKILMQIERAYGLTTPDMPECFGDPQKEKFQEELLRFDALYDVCESRLLAAKAAYNISDDMTGYLSASSMLDKLRHRVGNRKVTIDKGVELLRQLLAKIAEKIRSSPEDTSFLKDE